MKKVGLTIRGGGMRSVAYIGALKAFEEYNIPIDFIIGASGGAVVGASYALGKSLEEILNHFKTFKPVKFTGPKRIIKGNIFNYDKWLKHAKNLIPSSDLQDAKIKVLIQATNFDTHNLEYIESGDAANAVIASSAFLGPFKYGNKQFIDGEYIPVFGAEKLREIGAEKIIALIVENETIGRSGIMDNLLGPITITQNKVREMDLIMNPVDHIIKLQLKKVPLFGVNKIDESYKSGYEITKKYIIKNTLVEKIK